jgi:hypothetical protein
MSNLGPTYRNERDAALAQVEALRRENLALRQQLTGQKVTPEPSSARRSSRTAGFVASAGCAVLALAGLVGLLRSRQTAESVSAPVVETPLRVVPPTPRPQTSGIAQRVEVLTPLGDARPVGPPTLRITTATPALCRIHGTMLPQGVVVPLVAGPQTLRCEDASHTGTWLFEALPGQHLSFRGLLLDDRIHDGPPGGLSAVPGPALPPAAAVSLLPNGERRSRRIRPPGAASAPRGQRPAETARDAPFAR